MLYPWRIWKWECIFRFASTKVLQSTQMLGLPFLLVMIMGREAWWRWRWRCCFIGDNNDDDGDCIGDFGICENGSKFPGMPSPLRRSRVCCRSSSQITSHQFSQRCEYSSPSAQYVIHLCNWFSPPGSLHLVLPTWFSPHRIAPRGTLHRPPPELCTIPAKSKFNWRCGICAMISTDWGSFWLVYF